VASSDGGAFYDRMRASDAERDEVIGELQSMFAEGRLSQDTFAHRLDVAMHAREHGDLRSVLADLPRSRRRGAAQLWAAATDSCRRATRAVDRWLRKPPALLMLPGGEKDRYTIGREPACDMTLEDQTVSRWHATLVRSGAGWLLSDLGSTNGTRLNGWWVRSPMPVSPGDFVSFGAASFVIGGRVLPAAGAISPSGGAGTPASAR
jgi:Domain of unknown function (DUF1707)/Inner membrane component of T3SS, cytoplasmic domain